MFRYVQCVTALWCDSYLLCLLYNRHGAEANIRTLALVESGSQHVSHTEVLHQVKACINTEKKPSRTPEKKEKKSEPNSWAVQVKCFGFVQTWRVSASTPRTHCLDILMEEKGINTTDNVPVWVCPVCLECVYVSLQPVISSGVTAPRV